MRTEIIVEHEKCTLCKRCVRYCPADALRVLNDLLVVRYPGECWVCGVCELECPEDCIQVQFSSLT